MTSAKLTPSPGETSGLTHGVNDQVYADLIAGRSPGTIAVVGLLTPVGHGERRTAKGTKRHVQYDFLRLEPVRDPHDADDIAWRVTRAYEQRTSTSIDGQAELPLGLNSPSEQRLGLLDTLAEWASENGVTESEINDRWVQYYGGEEHSNAGSPKAGSLIQLLEFTRYVGAVEDTLLSSDADADQDEDDVEARADDGVDE